MFGLSELLAGKAWAADAASVSAGTVVAAAGDAGATDAAAAQAMGGGGTFMSYVPFILIAIIIYFFMIRPQQKSIAERNKMLKEIKKGDKIITGGGLSGTVVKTDGDDWLVVEIADGVTVRALRATINGPAETAKVPANQK